MAAHVSFHWPSKSYLCRILLFWKQPASCTVSERRWVYLGINLRPPIQKHLCFCFRNMLKTTKYESFTHRARVGIGGAVSLMSFYTPTQYKHPLIICCTQAHNVLRDSSFPRKCCIEEKSSIAHSCNDLYF